MLGMIAPIFEDFPPENLIDELRTQIERKQTQLILELLRKSEFDNINNELKKIKPQILLFLHKIRKLVIHTPEEDVQFEIQRDTKDNDLDGQETATLTTTILRSDKKTTERYLIIRRVGRVPVKDDRRENVEVAEAILAFPLDEQGRPFAHSQDTYAYLPINDYGFNYLIQGDFLLVASRESVDSSIWNDKVLEGVYWAFIDIAVPRFNRISNCTPRGQSLRYTWPLFLQDRGGSSEFWSTLKRWIFNGLKKTNTLESRQKERLARPSSLLYIPKEFRLHNKPLVEDENSKLRHLSFFYDSEIKNTLPQLKLMGVTEMEFRHFHQELQDLINKLGDSFLESQSKDWHSQIAYILNRRSSKSEAAKIPLIPLSDGRWVKPSQSNVFLPGDTNGAELPDGLDAFLVDHEACQDAKRMDFFLWVGLKKCDQAEVCRMIMGLYNPFRGRTLTGSVQDLIYLFQTPRTVYGESVKELQFIGTGSPSFVYGSQLYIVYPNKTTIISKYFGNSKSKMSTFDPVYIEAVRKLGMETKFINWACSYLDVSPLPRLVDYKGDPTQEFYFLKANAVEDLLLLLRDNWDRYARHFTSNGSRIKRSISQVGVKCIDGLTRRLDETVLPLEALKLEGPDLIFMDIPEPENSRWLNLSTFGVLTSLSTEFYLRELKALAALPVANIPSKRTIERIYTKLASDREHRLEIQREFAKYPLVYSQKFKRWVSLSDCVWKGPQELNIVYKLSSEYPRCSAFFRNSLNLGNATLDHIIKELQTVTSDTSFDTLRQLLLLFNGYLTLETPPSRISELEGKKIIPVTTPSGEVRMDYDKNMWYFADKTSLWERFKGKIPLIAFDVRTVRTLKPLVNAMRLSSYLLSKAVNQTLEIVGLKIKDEARTTDLRERAKYFVQLVTSLKTDASPQLLARLLSLNVWGVPSIKLTQSVDGVDVIEDTNQILFDDTDDSKLEIYLSIKDSRKEIVDFELSKKLIQYCEVTDHKFQGLVLPIIQYPHEEIKKLLEDNGLDEQEDHESSSEESNDEGTLSSQVDTSNTSVPRTPSSTRNISVRGSSSQTSKPSSILRDRIPGLDQSIMSVSMAAALPSTIPTLIITPSRIRTGPGTSSNSTSHDTWDTRHSRAGNELLSVSNLTGETATPTTEGEATTPTKEGESTASTTERQEEPPHDAFEFTNFRSEFTDVFGPDTPSRNSPTPVTPHHSVRRLYNRYPSRNSQTSSTQDHSFSRYNRSPHSPGMEPDPRNSMYGLQMQKVGLLGETFVNGWLSLHLKNNWDPTLHWTSRNRNYLHPNSPFTDSEKDYADFTYSDTDGSLTELLVKFGFLHDVETWLSNPPRYHLEVKSTSESCSEPFYMSNNQVGKVLSYSISFSNVENDLTSFRRVDGQFPGVAMRLLRMYTWLLGCITWIKRRPLILQHMLTHGRCIYQGNWISRHMITIR
ncbi:hypothetical protein ACLOAV_009880 [Pseudogymnoascus australis]